MEKELLLNISFPLCPRLCDHCNYRPLKGKAGPCAAYVKALIGEIGAAAEDFQDHRLKAVWLGGGMPGMMRGTELRALLRCIRNSFPLYPGTELSVELSPDYTTVDFLSSMDGAFRLRPSFGIPSAVPEELIALGSFFNFGAVEDEMELIRCRHITDFSFDLLYGLFYQTERSLRYSLEQALRLGAPHIGLAPFRLHPDSVCAKLVAEGRLPAPNEEAYEGLYRAGRDYLAGHGYIPYAHGRFALPGHESGYWKAYMAGADILGAGLMARSRFEDMVVVNTGDFKVYIEHPEDPACTCLSSAILDERGLALDAVKRGLLNPQGLLFPEGLQPLRDALEAQGLLLTEDGRSRLSDGAAADYEKRLLPLLA